MILYLIKQCIKLFQNKASILFTFEYLNFPPFWCLLEFVGQQPVTSELLMPTPPVCKHPDSNVFVIFSMFVQQRQQPAAAVY